MIKLSDELWTILLNGCRKVTVMDYGHDIQPLLDLGYVELVAEECNGLYYVTPVGVLALLQHFINEYERYMNEAP